MTMRFENPPINELVIATYFNPPLFALRNEHVGLFWSKIREEFPNVEQKHPVGGAAALGFTGNDDALKQVGEDVFPMPRFWFVSDDETHLIQLQKNAFMFNWRSREAEYPRYAGLLKPAFDRHYRVFKNFAQDEAGVPEVKVDHCELTYVNLIKPCQYWAGPRDTPAVLPFVEIPEFGTPSGGEFALNSTYNHVLAPDLHLRITVRTGEATDQPGTPVLVFELSARGRLGQAAKSAVDVWFDRAHDAIVDCFVNITSAEVQQNHWQRTGAAK